MESQVREYKVFLKKSDELIISSEDKSVKIPTDKGQLEVPVELLKRSISKINDYGEIALMRGERIRLNNEIILDIDGGVRMTLNKEFYMNLYNFVKVFKEFSIYGITFRLSKKGYLKNQYDQIITEKYIKIAELPVMQKFITTKGILYINVEYEEVIRSGECKRVSRISLCWP